MTERTGYSGPPRRPEDVIAADANATARFGDPLLLDLGGQGVRSLSWWRGRYLVIAGPYDRDGGSRLFEWDGQGTPRAAAIDFTNFNPEGYETKQLWATSKDGTRVPLHRRHCQP